MNRKRKWTIGTLLMLALLPLVWRELEAYDYANSNGITRAEIDTNRVIARHEKAAMRVRLALG